MSALNRGNVQSLIFGPSPYPISRHLLFNIPIGASGRHFLLELLPLVSSGELKPGDGPSLVNLSLSWTGLLALDAFDTMGGVATAAAAFYMFNEPPHAESLRAVGPSAPETWWGGRFTANDIHVILHAWVKDEEALRAFTSRARDAAARFGIRELIAASDGESITGRQIDRQLLHFGYQDGISHPDIDWDSDIPREGALPRGDFLLGYPSPHFGTFPDTPPFSDFVRDGSLSAFMLLHQDVAAFNRFLRINAPAAAPGRSQADAEEYLAAKMMGRWRDGTPLALSPEQSNPALARRDDFDYADDLQGVRCPLSAHIRAANARSQPLNLLNRRLFPGGFPRLLRRGSPYGPRLEGEADDGRDRGIVGMFLCANLNKQFYTVMRWLGRTDFSPVFPNPVGQDPIVGTMEFSGASPEFLIPRLDGSQLSLNRVVDFVRIQGVSLQFLPSMRCLQALAA